MKGYILVTLMFFVGCMPEIKPLPKNLGNYVNICLDTRGVYEVRVSHHPINNKDWVWGITRQFSSGDSALAFAEEYRYEESKIDTFIVSSMNP